MWTSALVIVNSLSSYIYYPSSNPVKFQRECLTVLT